jgi:hypothetical protein
MGPIFEALIKRGEIQDASAQNASPQGAREFMKAAYPGVGKTPVEGTMTGDASDQVDYDEELGVLVDASTLDEKVRQLLESAGSHYNYKVATQQGLAKRVDPEVLAAIRRLQTAAPLLNRAVIMMLQRKSN